MRPGVQWMNRENDDPILELLDDTGLALKPAAIHYNLTTRNNVDISLRTVHNRLKLLMKHGLVIKEDEENGRYAITNLGQRYLSGEASEDELQSSSD
jgi:repressor of nif and glnA expression